MALDLRLENPFNRIFENFVKDLNDVSQRNIANRGVRPWAPLLDLHENDNEYIMSTELPGIKKEDINIDIRDNILYISGETKEEKKSEEGTTHIQERRWGSFSRALSLPRNVKADDVVAKYENGVLEVKIPKAEQSGKKITIK
ncbi:11_t:CDS:2 [Entrophospora sp. SA101]|nr:6741_t:CDS:2 [Entrophospora sp. SA101]CAJ0645888.1 11_t:CDS:2 [Entrophospora sp. SA101]CAJ0842383.1 10233_t:CDS:2 [Entrophospora sp. SA101]CAJ0850761.1 6863_t:CDS:2 [Entrophospora sp. SA101]